MEGPARWPLEAADLYTLNKPARARAYEALQEKLLRERALSQPCPSLHSRDAAAAQRCERDRERLTALLARYAGEEAPVPEAATAEPDNFRLFRLYVDTMEDFRRTAPANH